MNTKSMTRLLYAALLIAALTPMTWGQLDPLGDDPLGGAKAGAEPAANDQLDGVFEGMSDKEMAEFIKNAIRRRLVTERMQVLADIEDNMLLLYDDADVDEARKILRDEEAANTQADNIDRIIRAFAVVESDLAKPYDLYRKGMALKEEGKDEQAGKHFDQAAPMLKKILNSNEANYFSAAKHYLYARVLAESGKGWDAIDAYGNVIANMPDRLSFAAGAALASASTFENMGRGYYALDMYQYILNNYPATLSTDQLQHVLARLKTLKGMYGDPMGAITQRMDQVRKRLDELDSGQTTQEKQEEIVAILTDMIKVLEEQKKKDPNQQQNNQQKQGQKPGEKQGQKPGESKGRGQRSGSKPKKGDGSKPAQSSYLPEGISGRIELKSESREEVEESGAWAQLPPREQQKVKEMLKNKLSDKHRDAIREYLKARARTEE